MKTSIKRLAAVAAVSAAVLGTGATAAFASGPSGGGPVSVSATVPSSITLTGLSSSISFGSIIPGQANTATAAEAYQVSTNDQTGYTLTIQPGASSLTGIGGSIPDSMLSVAETSGNGHGGYFSGGGSVTVDNPNTAVNRSYSEDWTLNVPGNQAPGSYSESFQYLALGN
jgi:hypothetical protein